MMCDELVWKDKNLRWNKIMFKKELDSRFKKEMK